MSLVHRHAVIVISIVIIIIFGIIGSDMLRQAMMGLSLAVLMSFLLMAAEGQGGYYANCDKDTYNEFMDKFTACYRSPWNKAHDVKLENDERCEAVKDVVKCIGTSAEVGVDLK